MGSCLFVNPVSKHENMDVLLFVLRATVNIFTLLHKRKILYMHVHPSPRRDVSKQGTIWNLEVICLL